MPADHGLGLHDDQDVSPLRPAVTKHSPEESVQAVQFWPWSFPFEDIDLLSKSENLKGGSTSINRAFSTFFPDASNRGARNRIRNDCHSPAGLLAFRSGLVPPSPFPLIHRS